MADRLPNYEKARIDPRKLRDYVLNPSHESGRYKAAFFSQIGYGAEHWQLLERDIREQHLSQEAEPGRPSPFGKKYTISAPLVGPNGKMRWVTTVWIVRPGNNWPELVTVEPATRQKANQDG